MSIYGNQWEPGDPPDIDGPIRGKQLKLRGMGLAAAAHPESLKAARWIAELIGAQQPTVTADDVFSYMNPESLGPAAGSIFREGPWEFSHWQESKRESNHGRPLRAWRLRANA